jgi:hypothetical protein
VEEDRLVEVEAYDMDDFPFVGVAAVVVVRHSPVIHTCVLRHSFLVAILQYLRYYQHHRYDYHHH